MGKKKTGLITDEVRELINEVARETASTAYIDGIGGEVNYFRAMESLLFNYKKLAALVADYEAYTHVELQGRSASISSYSPSSGCTYRTEEDILEEIVGNILDEYDEEEEQIVTDADGSYIIEGQADLEDVEAKLGIEFECEDIDTLSGFMIYKLGEIPDDGENFEVEYKGYIFRTLDVRGRMILKVKVEKTSQGQHA